MSDLPAPAVSQADGYSELPPPKSALTLAPFNLAAALRGEAFIHRFDAPGPSPAERVSREIRALDHPEHPAYLVWSGEWLPYPMTDEGLAQMEKDFFMVDLSPYRPKSAICRGSVVDPDQKAVR